MNKFPVKLNPIFSLLTLFLAPNSTLVSYVTNETLQPVFVTYKILSSNKHVALYFDDISQHIYQQIAAIESLFILIFCFRPKCPTFVLEYCVLTRIYWSLSVRFYCQVCSWQYCTYSTSNFLLEKLAIKLKTVPFKDEFHESAKGSRVYRLYLVQVFRCSFQRHLGMHLVPPLLEYSYTQVPSTWIPQPTCTVVIILKTVLKLH